MTKHKNVYKENAFKDAFTKKEVVAGFIEQFLSPQVVQQTNLESLELLHHSFINTSSELFFSDLLYTAEIANHRSYFYFLCELEPYSNEIIRSQLLRIIVHFLDTFAKSESENKKFPALYPVVLNFRDGEWSKVRSIKELFSDSHGVQQFIPEFVFNEFNLIGVPEHLIKGPHPLQQLLTVSRQTLNSDGCLSCMPKIVDGVFDSYLDFDKQLENFESVVTFIANTIKPDDIKTLQEKIQYSFVQEDAALVKKIYDRGVSDGIEMGLNIGVKQGIEVKEAEIIRNLVSRGFDETTIAEIIGKPLNQIKDFSCLSCCALF